MTITIINTAIGSQIRQHFEREDLTGFVHVFAVDSFTIMSFHTESSMAFELSIL